MATLEIKPGATVDVLTRDELREVLAEFTDLFEHKVAEDVRAETQGKTDATGGVVIAAYTVPPGMRFRLTRLVLKADGFTFGTPYAGTGYLEVRRNGQVVDGRPLANNVPSVGVDGSSTAARFLNGETVEIAIIGATVGVNFAPLIEGELYPLEA